jgi:hypothetical protein
MRVELDDSYLNSAAAFQGNVQGPPAAKFAFKASHTNFKRPSFHGKVNRAIGAAAHHTIHPSERFQILIYKRTLALPSSRSAHRLVHQQLLSLSFSFPPPSVSSHIA